MALTVIMSLVLAYLLGSIPSAVLVGKSYYGVDVREHGSMNAGATNTFRVLGKKAGTIVLLMDIFKGFTAANLVYFIPEGDLFESVVSVKIVLGVTAVIGHLFPIFARFKGGKGIATLLGLVLSIHPLLALGCVLIFLLILIWTHMVSAGSILATLSFGILSYLLYGLSEPVLQIFGIFAIILVLYTHRANLGRIWRGEEKKIYLFRKKEETNA
jgi:glycerol-3-phosphate acyltransferase PlsY